MGCKGCVWYWYDEYEKRDSCHYDGLHAKAPCVADSEEEKKPMTNFQMLEELRDFYPKRKMIVTPEETIHVKNVLRLSERSDIDLRNIRDFTVMYYSVRDNLTCSDAMQESAIVSVIDHEIFHRGLEV